MQSFLVRSLTQPSSHEPADPSVQPRQPIFGCSCGYDDDDSDSVCAHADGTHRALHSPWSVSSACTPPPALSLPSTFDDQSEELAKKRASHRRRRRRYRQQQGGENIEDRRGRGRKKRSDAAKGKIDNRLHSLSVNEVIRRKKPRQRSRFDAASRPAKRRRKTFEWWRGMKIDTSFAGQHREAPIVK